MQLQQLASDVDSDEEDALRRQVDPRWSRVAGAAEREDELDAEPESGEAMPPEELHAQQLGACPGHGRQVAREAERVGAQQGGQLANRGVREACVALALPHPRLSRYRGRPSWLMCRRGSSRAAL